MKLNIPKKAALALAAALSLSAFVPALSAAPLASGDVVTVANGTWGNTIGGEFAISYAGGSFISFCLETNETIGYGTPYTVTVSNTASQGGSGALANAGSGDVSGHAGVFDPLSNATAWLYTQYLAGALAGQGANDESANKAQYAIWFLENEIEAANSWAMDAIAAVNLGWTNPSGAGHVSVLNLVDAQGGLHQDQLYMAPVAIPEPETYAMLLAGLGLMGFVARRRQRRSVTA